MKLFDNLEEWKAIQQTLPLIHLSAQHAKNTLSNLHGDKKYHDIVDDLCQEIKMISLSGPQGSYLSETTVRMCESRLINVPQLFESFADEKSSKAALSSASKCRLSDTDESIPPSSFPDNLRKHFPKLGRFSECKAERIPSEYLLHFDSSTITIVTLQRAVEIITSVNRFLMSIASTPLRSFTSSSTGKAAIEVDDRIRNFTGNILQKLYSLFSKCKHGVSHQMMLQFPELKDLNKNIHLATLNLLLSSCRGHDSDDITWQGASCSYTPNTHETGDTELDAVDDLCCVIQKFLHLNEHLQFQLLNGELVSIENTDSLISQENTILGQSLYDLIRAKYFQRITWTSENRFTIWEKRILALNLGFLFMYLYDCKWIRRGWKAANMHFLAPLEMHQRENLLQVPPYLGCGSHLAGINEEIEHPFFKGHSDFLSFGKLLLELEFGEEITITQRDRLGTPSLYITLLVALEQGRMSANKYYIEAIRGCLQLYKNPGQPESVRGRIYNKIVANLEKEMTCLEKPYPPQALEPQAHGENHRLENDERSDIASTPLRSLNPSITAISCDMEHPEHSVFDPIKSLRSKVDESILSIATKPIDAKCRETSPGKEPQTDKLSVVQNLRRSERLGNTSVKKEAFQDLNSPLILPYASENSPISEAREMRPLATKENFPDVLRDLSEKVDSNVSGVMKKDPVSLFDGSDYCPDRSQMRSSEEFFASYKAFKMNILQRHVSPNNETPREKAKISVCVIDTGIDRSHPSIKGGMRRGSIRDCRSWIGAPGNVHDEYGHGTHSVQFILDASDNVDVYVAKISDSADIDRSDIGRIAAAINHAVIEWDVDIITMSFGFPRVDLNVEKAINNARARGKLLFAAAANHGNNGVRAYPANHGNVICIGASDGKGKDGRISPAAGEHDENFITLGIAIPLIWKGERIYRSGTSYATPIAVGFAVNILELVRWSLGEEEFERLKHDHYLMRRIFKLMSERDNGYSFIAPWLLWGPKDTQLVNGLIRNVLYG